MPATRRSTRLASSQTSSSPAKDESPKAATGSKRKSDTGSSPAPKRGKKDVPKTQTTIEESMDVDQPEKPVSQNESKSEDSGSKLEQTSTKDDHVAPEAEKATKTEDEQPTHSHADSSTKDNQEGLSKQPEGQRTEQSHEQPNDTKSEAQPNNGGESTSAQPDRGSVKQKEDSKEEPAKEPQKQPEEGEANQSSTKTEQQSHEAADGEPNGKSEEKPSTNGDAIEPHARDSETPSSIMEKGLIYFFFRGRVGIDNPSDVQDIARSHIVLRPLPHGAKLGDGPIGPSNNKCRLLALPKKVLPTSGKDRFMTFVEKAHTSFPELKESYLPADDYATQTAGVRHTPPARPIAEGVYAITTTGRENHLAYMLTIPSELGDVQKDMGLREQGSFIVSCKNPQFPGPSYASLPQSPDYPKEILDEFRSLRWMPLQPKHLDYANTQFLLIGESGGLDKATDVPESKKEGQEDDPKQEIERLEGEDEIRIKHLEGDDAIFQDLGVSKKDYSQVPTTWDD